MPGRRGLSRVPVSDTTEAGSRAHSMASRPARAAALASAVPHAPAPITAMRSMLTPLPRAGERIERPARARRDVERVGETECKPLAAGPGNHGAVVGAQFRRRRDQYGALLDGDTM